MSQRQLDVADVARFLRRMYSEVVDVQLLKGGEWSTAFGFTVGEQRLVVRFGDHVGDYEKDRFAGAWRQPLLPIPVVLDVGEAFGGAFAVSERLEGDRLDTLPPARLAIALDSLLETSQCWRTSRCREPGSGCGRRRRGMHQTPHGVSS